MTKQELWQTFLKTGRVSDYIAYERAREDAPAQDIRNVYPQEFAEEFIQNFDSDFPAMEQIGAEPDAGEIFDDDV